mgnify:CR=1 FL=1
MVLNDFSICPKTNTNQQQSKSEAKAIPREAKVQEWFGESGPGEGLPDLKVVVVLSMFSAWTIWFFLAFESGRSWEKGTNNCQNGSQIHQNETRGDPLGGAGGVKTAAGGRGTKKLHIFNAHRVAFGAFSVPLMPKWAPFWTPLDFEGPK